MRRMIELLVTSSDRLCILGKERRLFSAQGILAASLRRHTAVLVVMSQGSLVLRLRAALASHNLRACSFLGRRKLEKPRLFLHAVAPCVASGMRIVQRVVEKPALWEASQATAHK